MGGIPGAPGPPGGGYQPCCGRKGAGRGPVSEKPNITAVGSFLLKKFFIQSPRAVLVDTSFHFAAKRACWSDVFGAYLFTVKRRRHESTGHRNAKPYGRPRRSF